jgi:hypothetical protein
MHPKELRITFDETATEGVCLKAELTPGSKRYDIFFRSNDIELTKNTEVLFAAALFPCITTGRTLVADGTISQKLLTALDPICDFYRTLNPSFKGIKIKNVTVEPKGPPKENRVGTFFSAGLDSFYTFLKNQEEITDLIFVHGFDIRLNDHALRKRTSEVMRHVGLSFGKRVVEVETNVRSLIDPYVPWLHSHVAGLASIGHLLSPYFRRIYIPGTHTHGDTDQFPWWSHPSLDPLWSTEALEFIHDGCEATRIQKAALIAQSDVALKSLRVCFESANNAYNCGYCEKCIRTMINLHIVGALDQCTTFNTRLDPKRISRLLIANRGVRVFVEENLKALENRPADRELFNALRRALKRSWWLKPPVYMVLRWIYRALKSLTKRSD